MALRINTCDVPKCFDDCREAGEHVLTVVFSSKAMKFTNHGFIPMLACSISASISESILSSSDIKEPVGLEKAGELMFGEIW